VEFDFDIDGILHVSAVDRGSGKQAHTSVKAARTQLSASDIASARTDLEALEMEDWADEEDDDEFEDDEFEDDEVVEVSTPQGDLPTPKLETLGALNRARRIVTLGTEDTTGLKAAIASLEEAINRGDEAVTADRTEELLDLLYDFEE
jgi:molecular chaperone DnaK